MGKSRKAQKKETYKKSGPNSLHAGKPPRKIWLLLLLPLSLLLILAAKYSVFFAEEIYAKRVYRVLSVVLNRLTGLLPFSVGEWMVISVPLLILSGLLVFIYRLVRGRSGYVCRGKDAGGRLHTFGDAFLNLLCTCSVVLFVFILFCGINYYRRPFSYYSGLTVRESTKEELYGLCVYLAEQAAEAGSELETSFLEMDRDTARLTKQTYQELAKETKKAMELLGEQYPVLSGAYTTVKPVVFSGFMTKMEITGIFFPFTMEANVNTDCTAFTVPATMCHELSHLRGFMREDEANYIAYLACRDSDNAYLRYSGSMLALVYAANQLYEADPVLYRTLRDSCYTEKMKDDYRKDTEYWARHYDAVVSTISNKMNDVYLKANDQSDGAKSYGRMVDLLLAEYREVKEK